MGRACMFIGMCGADQTMSAAATLFWNTEYGPAQRGSGPSRVAAYCDRRRIRAYNVTGQTTWEWMKWAALTGRGAAIGAGQTIFKTLVGYNATTGTWYVCNNNSPRLIEAYSDAAFRRLHWPAANGPSFSTTRRIRNVRSTSAGGSTLTRTITLDFGAHHACVCSVTAGRLVLGRTQCTTTATRS